MLYKLIWKIEYDMIVNTTINRKMNKKWIEIVTYVVFLVYWYLWYEFNKICINVADNHTSLIPISYRNNKRVELSMY